MLPQNGTIWRLEEDIVSWVACRKFLPDLLGKVIVGILRFPESMDDFEIIEQRTVWVQCPIATLEGVFFGQRPSVLTTTIPQQGGKRWRNCAFVKQVQRGKPLECVVVGFHDIMTGFEIQHWHSKDNLTW